MVSKGVGHYAENCVRCHGGPGVERGEIGKGITPDAPDLAKTAGHWSAAELFWIVKNGVRMTAMRAWGPTHSDEELWSIVAFLERLPEISPAQYHSMREKGTHAEYGAAPEHHHGGTKAH